MDVQRNSLRVTPKSNHCLLWRKYRSRVRWFHSKGAYLIICWVFLYILLLSSVIRIKQMMTHQLPGYQEWLNIMVPFIIVLLAAAPLGWMAYTRLGIYKTLKFSLLLAFTATYAISVFSLILKVDFVHSNKYFSMLFLSLIFSIFALGVTASVVCILQLGLDQMPDASSASITSFIAWFGVSFAAGIWLGELLHAIWLCYSPHEYTVEKVQLWSLLPVVCVSIILITDFLFSNKWLVNTEPRSSQSIRTIYRVLKFAAKHKAPLNRSALTYWEEDVPSRMDLGKSRYGGPFTTEQVEDVKTILRLLALSLSFWFINFGLTITPKKVEEAPSSVFINTTFCSRLALTAFTYESEWCLLVTAILFEFAIYPLIRNRIPSIIRRIGFLSLLTTILSAVLLILQLSHQLTGNQFVQTSAGILLHLSKGIFAFFLLTAYIELVCAQAPCNFRGYGIGYILICCGLSFGVQQLYLRFHSISFCDDCDNSAILLGIKTGVSLVGFILYCVLAHWYKRRVRDEDYHPQPVVEEIYD